MSDDILRRAIEAEARDQTFPDGRPGRFLSGAALVSLGERFGTAPRDVEIAALEAGVCPLRYARNLRAFTMAEQARLLTSTVAQVGLGGLGGGILENLVRAGVGTLNAADGDVFEETNLNRQLLSSCDGLGVPKAVMATRRARAVNPSVTFTARNAFLDAAGMMDLLTGADIVVDALGGLADRPALAAAAKAHSLPLVTGAVAGYTALVATVLPGDPSPFTLFSGGGGTAAEEVLGCPSPAVMLKTGSRVEES